MINLPLSWCLTPIEKIIESLNYGTSKKCSYDPNGVPVLRIPNIGNGIIEQSDLKYTDLTEKEFEQLRLIPGDILVIRSNGSVSLVGKSAVVRESERDFAYAGYLIRLRPNDFLLDSNYLNLCLSSHKVRLQIEVPAKSTSGVHNINSQELKQIKVPLPPLNEQRRILAKIEALKARSQRVKEELEAIPALLDQFRQSVLAAAFRGDLTADWREKNPDVEPASVLLERIRAERRRRWEEAELEKMKAQGKTPKDDKWKEKYVQPTAADTSNLPAIPKSWTWATLPEIGELNRGKSKHRPRNDPALFGGSYPFIQTGEIRSANGVISNFSQTYSEFGLKQSRLWSKGTLCITIAANIAETAILGFPACFPDSVVGFLPETSGCDVRFVEFFMRTAKNDLERFAPATAQKNINLEILRVVAIPFPPLEEQQKIIAAIERYFSVAEAIERMLSENSEQIQHLEQSMLAKAFRGELVPQDPNDEPASVLLERIHAEREKLDTRKKAKGKTEKKSRKAKPEAAEPEQLSLPGFE